MGKRPGFEPARNSGFRAGSGFENRHSRVPGRVRDRPPGTEIPGKPGVFKAKFLKFSTYRDPFFQKTFSKLFFFNFFSNFFHRIIKAERRISTFSFQAERRIIAIDYVDVDPSLVC